MSNTLALASVTATLQYLIQKELQEEARMQASWMKNSDKEHIEPLEHVRVRVGSPKPPKAEETPLEINICLYQATPNISYRNADLPTYSSAGSQIIQKQLALDAYYIISFYGNEQKLEPERLMGATLFAMHKYPIFTPHLLEEAAKNSTYGFMKFTTLKDQIDSVKTTPLILSLEELTKIWSVFYQVPYALSFAYKASVVLIKGQDEVIEPHLPKEVHLHVGPQLQRGTKQ